MKKRYKTHNKYKGIILSSLLICVVFLTVGFSACSSTMGIYGLSALVRIEKDIRITDISLYSATNEAMSNYEEFNVKNIYGSLNLPNSNSEAVYQVEVTNIGNVEMGILEITGLPDNLKYTIEESNYKMNDPICDDSNTSQCKLGAVKNIYLKIGYKENGFDAENTDYQFTLDFEFKRVYPITYNGFTDVSSLPKYIMKDESKTITFDNNNPIPVDVEISGATGSYTSPTLTISNANKNVIIYRRFAINYVLDGGVQAENQITSIASNERITLLDATKEGYSFIGWYNNADLEGDSIASLSNINDDITLYAGWAQYDYFIKHKEFDGTVGNIIDTGIALYSTENVNKNFRIKFRIDSFDSSYPNTTIVNNQAPTILSSMVETGSPYSGFVYRVFNNNGTKYNLKINDSHITSYNGFYPLESGIAVEIVREDGIMYGKVNSSVYTPITYYPSIIDTFDVPLTIGGNINSSGAYDRLFKGALSDVSVEFYEGTLVNNEHHSYTYTETRTPDSYTLDGTIEFTGNNYIDTGINLFSAENINKDFEITFTVEQIGGNAAQATLVNLKDENQNNVWPGLAYRTKSGSTLEFTARWPGQTAATAQDSKKPPKTVGIYRRNGILYYSSGNSTETKLIEVPPEALTVPFNANLTFGASTKNGSPFRYFSGIVSDINVNLYEN